MIMVFTIEFDSIVPNLWQLLSDITTHKDSFQVDPEVLRLHPVLNDLSGVGQTLDPLLDFRLEWSIVPAWNAK